MIKIKLLKKINIFPSLKGNTTKAEIGFIFSFIIFTFFFILFSPTEVYADNWYDVNYNYRQPITVTNNVGASLTNFQVRLTLNTSALVGASKMQPDCDDIRITDNDKTTSLNYFIQSGCNTTSTVIWVKIPTLDASTTRTIYMYYGYSSASSASTGDNTFDFFDDFTGTSLDTSKWSDWNPNSFGTLNISGGTLAVSMASTGGYSTVRNRGIISNSSFAFASSGSLIETYSRWAFAEPGSSSQYNGVVKSVNIFDSPNPTGICSWRSYNAGGNSYYFSYMRYRGFLGINLNQFSFSRCSSSSHTEVTTYYYGSGSGGAAWSNPTNFVLEQYRWFDSSGTKQGMRRSDNVGVGWTSDLWSQQSQTLLTLPNSYYLGWGLQNRSQATQSIWLDWYRIRKYASSEPTSSFGSEQVPQAAPTTPSLILPADTTTGISQTPTFKTVSTDINLDSLQYEIKVCKDSDMTNTCSTFTATNTGWSGADVDTTSYSTGTTATYIVPIGNSLSANTTYYWKTRAIDPLGLNNYSSTQTTPYSFTTLNNAPTDPTNTAPIHGAHHTSFTPTLIASAFSDPDSGDTQSASQWQVATDTGFSNIVWQTGTTGPANNNISITTTLNVGTTYYWHVRYKDNYSSWSNYSATTNFTTNQAPITPTNNFPTHGSSGVSRTPTLIASAFSDPDSGDTQSASQWQISTNSTFTAIVWDTGTSGAAVTSINVPITLNVGTTYYWHVRYEDNPWSAYSPTTYFITDNPPPTNSFKLKGIKLKGIKLK